MRCLKCGTHGYSRKTMTPEWRCRSVGCGYEWDTTTSPEELIERMETLRLEVERQLSSEIGRTSKLEHQLRFEEERRRNDQMELEALRLRADGWESQLRRDAEIAHRKDKNKNRGGWFSFGGFFIGILLGSLLFGWGPAGNLLAGILLGFAGYYVGENWDNLRSGNP